jgi:hypothetical protein
MPGRAGFLIFSQAAHFIVTSLKKEGIITRFFQSDFFRRYLQEGKLLTRNEENPFLSHAVTVRPRTSMRRFAIRVFV